MAGTIGVAHGAIEIERKRLDESHHILIGSQAMFQATLQYAKFRECSEVGVGGKLAYLSER